jgi:hypothetical protein
MCNDLGEGSRCCAFYSATGIVFTVSAKRIIEAASDTRYLLLILRCEGGGFLLVYRPCRFNAADICLVDAAAFIPIVFFFCILLPVTNTFSLYSDNEQQYLTKQKQSTAMGWSNDYDTTIFYCRN